MIDVIVTTDPFDIESYEHWETDDLIEFVRKEFAVWPEGARIYNGNIAESCDVTPFDERSIKYLSTLDGPIYIVVYPESSIIITIAAIAAAVLSVAAIFLLKPKLPDLGKSPSSNNELSERSNKARPNARIPDIFGRVRSVPDLVATPYRVFENSQEIEISYMCIGRGAYSIEDVRDGDTLLGSISGAGAAFYGPNTSPNSGTAQLQIGSAITQDLYDVVKINEVNGQTLAPPNRAVVDKQMRFVAPNVIENDGTKDFTIDFTSGQTIGVSGAEFSLTIGSEQISTSMRFEDGGIIRFETIDPTSYFAVSDTITLSNASFNGLDNGGVNYLFVDLFGTYVISAISSTTITLTSPASINADWSKLTNYTSDRTEYKSSSIGKSGLTQTIDLDGEFTIVSVSATEIVLSNPEATNTDYLELANFPSGTTPFTSVVLSTTGIVWVGWFDIPLEVVSGNKILCNIVAKQGLWGTNNDGEQFARTETVTIEVRPIDKDGTVTGAVETFGGTLIGSSTDKKQVALSIEVAPTFTSRAQARIRRTSQTDHKKSHGCVDELKWDSCYGLGPVAATDFGDVTTVFTRTYATQSATAVKERRFNALVTRKIPTWNGMTFGAATAQTDAAAIICAMALDPKIGNREISELNVAQIYAETAALRSYFGFSESTDFSYTFDDDNTSFEESADIIAQSVFCNIYRLGNVIQLYGEKATTNSRLLFNHRNIVPRSETRTVTFGAVNNYDGIELKYINPEDDAETTIYLPADQSAVNPRKIETTGIRHTNQAMLHAYRNYNKIIYQNTTTQFEGLEESDFLVNSDRILISDTTRADSKEGFVKEQVGLVLTISQPFTPVAGVTYAIYLQHTNGTVEAIPMTAGTDAFHIVLDSAPSFPLSLGYGQSVVASYWIVGNNEPRASAFLMTEKEPAGKNTFSITAIN